MPPCSCNPPSKLTEISRARGRLVPGAATRDDSPGIAADRWSHATARDKTCSAEAGFMLVAVVVMAALLLIALAVAAPVIATELRRDKEIESMHRAQQYVRAIQLYQRKFAGQYPASIKVLESTNNVRYLRQQYVDPLTGKADWRLIHLGEQKTKIHVFFGEELGGTSSGLGSAAGLGSGAAATAGTSSTATIGATSALASGFGGASITSTTGGTSGSTGSNTGMFGDSAGGVIVGVGPSKTGASISQPNAQASYESWEFWYDPRIEALRSGVSVTGGGISSTSAGSFGQNAVTGQSNGGSGSFGSTQGGQGGFGSPGVTGGSGLGSGFGFGTTPAGPAAPGSPGSNNSGTNNSGTGSSGNSSGSPNPNNPQ